MAWQHLPKTAAATANATRARPLRVNIHNNADIEVMEWFGVYGHVQRSELRMIRSLIGGYWKMLQP